MTELTTTYKGTIERLSGAAMSGLWELTISGQTVYISSGTGVRALARAFGATEGSDDLLDKIVGQEIVYSVDFMGVMEGFTPIDEWDIDVEIPEDGLDGDALRAAIEANLDFGPWRRCVNRIRQVLISAARRFGGDA